MRTLVLFLCFAAGFPVAAWRAAEAASPPIQIQPIVLCDDNGHNCAADPTTPGGLYSQLFDQAVLDRIYAQTAGSDYTGTSFPGISFNILPAAYLSNSSYLTTTVDLDGSPGNLTTNTLDEAHQLIRLPDPAMSTNPNTLNIFLVDQLQITNNNVLTTDTIHGYGLVTSNGAILDTGAHIDTLAHEVAHNVGLNDIASDPTNLLQGSNRYVPTAPTDPAIGTAIDLLSGSAGLDQINRANQPLFTVGLAKAEVNEGSTPCIAGISIFCSFRIVTNGTNPNESLLAVHIRFLDGTSLFNGALIDRPLYGVFGLTNEQAIALGCDDTGLSLVHLAGNGAEIDLTPPPGCLLPGIGTAVAVTYNTTYDPPLSIGFDFADGSTSTATFDATSGIAATTETIATSGINTVALSLVGDGSYIVTDDGAQPFVSSVPEPSSSYVLFSSLLLAGGLIRRKRRRS